MPFPQRSIVVLSLAAAYATSVYARQQGQGTPTAPSVTSVPSVPSAKSFVWAFAVAYLVQAAAYGFYAIFLYPRLVSPLRHLPQVTKGNHWLYGQFARIIREASGKPALEWINSIPNDGLIRYLGMFNHERLLITKPKALAEVLVTRNYDYEKPRMVRDTLERLLGVGLLLAEGDEHKFQRKHLSPAFAFRHVKDLYPVFWDKGRESVLALEAAIQAQTEAEAEETDTEKTNKAKKTGAFEINSWASRTTLDIIGIAGLGRDFGAIQDPDNKLAAQYHLMLHPDSSVRLMHFLALIFPRWLLDLLPLRRNANIESANVYIKKMCRNLVAEKRLLLEKASDKNEDKKELDILSVAMASGGFTDEKLASQLMTFLAAGHETTSAALTWAIYQLCIHTDMQDRLRAEIRQHLPSLNEAGAPSPTDIDQLPYLNAVCSEVLRYMAPVPSTVREARVDTVIQGQHVPRGTLVMLVPWAVNRSVELWGPTATQFDPARWLSGATPPTASNYSFLSFLHGPRSCIGMGFARAEFACVLAAWVGRFEFRIQDPVDLDEDKLEILGNVSSRPKKGMHVYAKIVDGW